MKITFRLVLAVGMWMTALFMVLISDTVPLSVHFMIDPLAFLIGTAALIPSSAVLAEHERLRAEDLIGTIARAAIDAVLDEREAAVREIRRSI